ncbi:MAG: ATPase [Alphaproteobacteria bacterium]|nr:ATPase [Alphaproteobacteria bacterium]
MPQITQLPLIYASQIFWLLVVFGVLFFGIGRTMLPKIQSTVEARSRRISEDLAEAERARTAADETEAAWRARMDESRAEAMKLTAAAKIETAREAELRIKSADADATARIDAAEAKIQAATEAAMAEIEGVAAEAAQEMVTKLAGVSVSRERAAAAVKEALNG